MKERKDSWSTNDDSLLSKVVLDYIRSGKTQLQAFEKVSEALGRTAAGCGFRWNSTVRHNYVKEIEAAKIIRFSLKEKRKIKEPKDIVRLNNNGEISIENIIISLNNIKREYEEMKLQLSKQNKIIQEYETKNKVSFNDTLPEDMKNFLRILGKSNIYDNLPELNDKEPAI